MYFARLEFQPDAQVDAEARRLSTEAMRLADEYTGVRLDGSGDSIPALDSVLQRIRELLTALPASASEAAAEGFVKPFGSYFGEVLRSTVGGAWGVGHWHGEQQPAVELGQRRYVILPYAQVRSRLTRIGEESIAGYFQRVCQSLSAPPLQGFDPPVRELYTLRHDQGYFETGTTADGCRVLLSYWMAVFFDKEGTYVRCQAPPLPGDTEDEAAVEAALRAWKREIGFRARPIRIRKFCVPEHGIGIEDWPDDFEDFVKAPELYEPDPEERENTFASVREWNESGSFVLYWGNDLWLDGEGTVTSS
jgi:hypothetical protein